MFSLRPVHVAPLVPLVLIALLVTSPIGDNSFLWHVRAGSLQKDLVRVLSQDPFSIDFAGESWRTQSWLLELGYAYLEQWFTGLAWANIMVGILGAIVVALVGLSMYRGARSPILIGFSLVVIVWLAAPFLQPRPVIASYVLLAALIVVLQNKERLIWLVVPIMWIWVATHGSWILGAALLFLEWLRSTDARVFKAGVVSFVSVFLTAHGVAVWQVLGDFASAQGALALIDEWQSPSFDEIAQAPYLILIVGVVVAAVRGRIDMRDLIVILPFMFFGMTSQRAVFPAAIVLAPWAALGLPRLDLPRTSLSSRIPGLAMILMIFVALLPFLSRPLGALDQDRFPSPALQAALDGRNFFHDDVVGGYLIYDRWPETSTLIDDRAELYGEDFFTDFLNARNGQYEDFFAAYGFDAALTKEEWGLTDRLERDGWSRAAEANEMIVFHRP